MDQLNFPGYSFRTKSNEKQAAIFDVVRKKFVVLTPEEWVRQHVVQYLHQDLRYPLSWINVEKQLKVAGLSKRYDVVVYDAHGKVQLMVECKAPSVKITQSTFDQIARYQMALKARYLMVTNGLDHYYCQLDPDKEGYRFLPSLPAYE